MLTQGREALAGLRTAGRDRRDIHWSAWLWVAVSPDRTEALDDARATVEFYAGMRQYEPMFTAMGFGKEAGAGLLGGVGAQGHGRTGGRRQRRDGRGVRGPGQRRRLPPEKVLFYVGGIAETFCS
jgi:hypothetical protein